MMELAKEWYPKKPVTSLDLSEAQKELLSIADLESRQAYKGDVESLKALRLYKKALHLRIQNLRSPPTQNEIEKQREFTGIAEEERQRIISLLIETVKTEPGQAVRFLDAMEYWIAEEICRESQDAGSLSSMQHIENEQKIDLEEVAEMSVKLARRLGNLNPEIETILSCSLREKTNSLNAEILEVLKAELDDLHNVAKYHADQIVIPQGPKIKFRKDIFVGRILIEIQRYFRLENFSRYGTKKVLTDVAGSLCEIAGHGDGNMEKIVREVRKIREEN